MKFNPDLVTIAGNWKMNGHIDTSVDVEKLINLINGDDAKSFYFLRTHLSRNLLISVRILS